MLTHAFRGRSLEEALAGARKPLVASAWSDPDAKCATLEWLQNAFVPPSTPWPPTRSVGRQVTNRDADSHYGQSGHVVHRRQRWKGLPLHRCATGACSACSSALRNVPCILYAGGELSTLLNRREHRLHRCKRDRLFPAHHAVGCMYPHDFSRCARYAPSCWVSCATCHCKIAICWTVTN